MDSLEARRRTHDQATCAHCTTYDRWISEGWDPNSDRGRADQKRDATTRAVVAHVRAFEHVPRARASEVLDGSSPVKPFRMADGHDPHGCYPCMTYGLWVWPFATGAWGKRAEYGLDAREKVWLERAGDGYRFGQPWAQGTRLPDNITPDRFDLDHVLETRPEGMTAAEWAQRMELIDAPTPWDGLEDLFWRDWPRRQRQREEWLRDNITDATEFLRVFGLDMATSGTE